MTKYFICSILFLALVTGSSKTSSAGIVTITSATVSDQQTGDSKAPAKPGAETPIKSGPLTTAPHSPIEKGQGHAPAMDETPHIHHYHKNRVKKLKKHHGKCWFLSQLLVVVCQIVLLVIAYLHVVH